MKVCGSILIGVAQHGVKEVVGDVDGHGRGDEQRLISSALRMQNSSGVPARLQTNSPTHRGKG